MKSAFLLFLTHIFCCFARPSLEIQGHRGCRGIYPENTLPGFAAAISAGVDALEMDLLMTKEGDIVIHHDYFLNSTLCTHRDGARLVERRLIRCLTLKELKTFDCGSCRDPLFPRQTPLPGASIPTLEEVFDAFKHENVKLILEIKRDARHPSYTPPPEVLAKRVVDLVRAHHYGSRVCYSSFDIEVLKKVRDYAPEATLEFISESGEQMLERACALQASIVSPHHSLLRTKEDVRVLQEAGLRVIPWTVNDPKRWHELLEMGVDGLVTDYPQDLILSIK